MKTADERRTFVENLKQRLDDANAKLDELEVKANLGRADASDALRGYRDEIVERSRTLANEIKAAEKELREDAKVKAQLNWKRFKLDAQSLMDQVETKLTDLRQKAA